MAEQVPTIARLLKPEKDSSDRRPVKNKVQKRGVFFLLQKVTAKTPRQPHNSPQRHHDLPAKNTIKNAKPPAKSPIHHAAIFLVAKFRKITPR
ncbi:hypothetical protein RBB79_16295 [Tunturiibacter empetritectus]|uniref:Uncharacterized protein n=2 Tax=Tunturiibacter TaxID=3154218 RepID=A0A852VJ46_9BACT|nr:hypothetical protein [Edaphobacter lichenicola]NYF91179.1 hypothetical protein [Edaphobacter lichenicola]